MSNDSSSPSETVAQHSHYSKQRETNVNSCIILRMPFINSSQISFRASSVRVLNLTVKVTVKDLVMGAVLCYLLHFSNSCIKI